MSLTVAIGALLLTQVQKGPQATIIHKFNGSMPTGVTVSKNGRIFVTFPRWKDPVSATLCEIKAGKEVPFPNLGMNKLVKRDPTNHLINIQSAVIDDQDRLWAVDTGSVNRGTTLTGGPKLVCFDLNTNKIARKIVFPENVVYKTSYLNDVRFDLQHGKAGYAFLTDSSEKGPNGIVVVDLDSGQSWRKLNDDPTTKADQSFTPMAEGRPLLLRPKHGTPTKPKMGVDGIAIDVPADRLYYCPLVSRKLYSVSIAALENKDSLDPEVKRTVKEESKKPASDGLYNDGTGRVLFTDYENHQVQRLRRDGNIEPFLRLDSRYWPDTLSVKGADMYLIANELHRMPEYNRGKDLRQKPYLLVKVALPK